MKLLIVEDEASIMDRLTRLSRAVLGSRIQSIDTATRLLEAQRRIEQNHYDVLLLDLNLSGKDGFELLKDLSSRSFHTIVVSAYTERAIEAYELGVLDFVKKPFDEKRLSQAFHRILSTDTVQSHFAKFLAVRNVGRIELIALEEIDFVQADGPCSKIYKSDGTSKCHDKMLKDLQLILPQHFERVHKSYLANLKHIAELKSYPSHKHSLRFASGQEIPIGRAHVKLLRLRLQTGR